MDHQLAQKCVTCESLVNLLVREKEDARELKYAREVVHDTDLRAKLRIIYKLEMEIKAKDLQILELQNQIHGESEDIKNRNNLRSKQQSEENKPFMSTENGLKHQSYQQVILNEQIQTQPTIKKVFMIEETQDKPKRRREKKQSDKQSTRKSQTTKSKTLALNNSSTNSSARKRNNGSKNMSSNNSRQSASTKQRRKPQSRSYPNNQGSNNSQRKLGIKRTARKRTIKDNDHLRNESESPESILRRSQRNSRGQFVKIDGVMVELPYENQQIQQSIENEKKNIAIDSMSFVQQNGLKEEEVKSQVDEIKKDGIRDQSDGGRLKCPSSSCGATRGLIQSMKQHVRETRGNNGHDTVYCLKCDSVFFKQKDREEHDMLENCTKALINKHKACLSTRQKEIVYEYMKDGIVKDEEIEQHSEINLNVTPIRIEKPDESQVVHQLQEAPNIVVTNENQFEQ